MRFDKQDLLIFTVFFLLASFLNMKHQLILLGAALIIQGPFLILDRHMVPLLRKQPKLSVALGITCVFLAGVVWDYAFTL